MHIKPEHLLVGSSLRHARCSDPHCIALRASRPPVTLSPVSSGLRWATPVTSSLPPNVPILWILTRVIFLKTNWISHYLRSSVALVPHQGRTRWAMTFAVWFLPNTAEAPTKSCPEILLSPPQPQPTTHVQGAPAGLCPRWAGGAGGGREKLGSTQGREGARRDLGVQIQRHNQQDFQVGNAMPWAPSAGPSNLAPWALGRAHILLQ